MSATLVEEYESLTGSRDVDELVETDDLESLDAALAEVNLKLAQIAVTRAELWKRHDDLVAGKKEMRRRRARSYLDLRYPPITFFEILFDEEV